MAKHGLLIRINQNKGDFKMDNELKCLILEYENACNISTKLKSKKYDE